MFTLASFLISLEIGEQRVVMIFDVRLGSGFVPLCVRGTEGLSDRP